MDKLKQLKTRFGGKMRSQRLNDPRIRDTSSRALILQDVKGYKIQIDEFNNFFSIGIAVDADFAFSVNNADTLSLYSTLKHFPGTSYRVYFRDDASYIRQTGLSKNFWDALFTLFSKIGLTEDEHVFFYNNRIFFFIAGQRDVLSIFQDIIDFLEVFDSLFKKDLAIRISKEGIPANLLPLIPLVRKYGISDDDEREQMKKEISDRERASLINAVKPLFKEINAYLDTFRGRPMTMEATLFGRLAELVSELMP